MSNKPAPSDIIIPRDRIFVLNGENFVVDWGDNRVESLTDGRYYPVNAIETRHDMTAYELDQLVEGGYILRYDAEYIYLDVHRAATQGYQRQYYLHTRCTKDQLETVTNWLEAADLHENVAVRTLEKFVIIRGKNGIGFRSLEEVETARQRILVAVPQLSHMVIAFVDVFA